MKINTTRIKKNRKKLLNFFSVKILERFLNKRNPIKQFKMCDQLFLGKKFSQFQFYYFMNNTIHN